jgi:chaperone modulatory protein CbpM
MSPLDRLAAECGVAVDELTIWVERRWVLPGRSGAELLFSDADRARLRMIVEFRRDLAIDDEAMPVVLDLVDRLHGARAQLRRVLEAIADLPGPERGRVLGRLRGEGEL